MKKYIDGFLMAMGMYTILPCPQVWNEEGKPYVLPNFVMLGYLMGGIWAVVYWGAKALGIPEAMTGGILTVVPMLLTGSIHIDGWMDTCDAIFSGRELEKKREIIKDSHVGAFGVIGLGISMLMMYGGLTAMTQAGTRGSYLIWIPVISRSISGLYLLSAKPISEKGTGAGFAAGTKWGQKAGVGVLMGSAAAGLVVIGGWQGAVVLAAEVIVGVIAGAYAVKQMEGISGDLCGFMQTAAELGGILALGMLR